MAEKIAVITGAGSGMGKAFADQFPICADTLRLE